MTLLSFLQTRRSSRVKECSSSATSSGAAALADDKNLLLRFGGSDIRYLCMQHYGSNKLKTALDITRQIENWPTAFDLRLRRRRRGLRLLRFRNGLNVVCRGATRDWDVVHELLFAGGYGRALNYLKRLPGKPLVLDLGGHIGIFALLAASTHPGAEIHSCEPGPPNFRLFEMNCLANPATAERIHLRKHAVGGFARTTEWFFDELNPGGSSLFAKHGASYPVEIRTFADLVRSLAGPIGLVKIDIEGAEFELLERTPPEVWQRIEAISLELHEDPSGKVSQDVFFRRMASHGYRIEEEAVCSFFLHR